MKYKPLADMVAPDIKDWKDVAENVKVSFQKRMFKEYQSKTYKGKYGERKKAGKVKGQIGESMMSRPNLTVTGNMLKEIRATSTGNSAKLEWDGNNGAKIVQLDKGQFPMFVGQDPASKNVDKDIEKYVNKLYNKRVKAQTQKIVFKI